jgi:PTS system mannose-specific IIA component
MIGVVVVTHGLLATELLNAAETIVGDLPHFAAVSIGWHDDVEEARTEIVETIARLGADQGVIVLTDMFGGTPSNLAITLVEEGKVEVVTGVNLPMIVKLQTARGGAGVTLHAAAELLTAYGQKNITLASDLLRSKIEKSRQ